MTTTTPTAQGRPLYPIGARVRVLEDTCGADRGDVGVVTQIPYYSTWDELWVSIPGADNRHGYPLCYEEVEPYDALPEVGDVVTVLNQRGDVAPGDRGTVAALRLGWLVVDWDNGSPSNAPEYDEVIVIEKATPSPSTTTATKFNPLDHFTPEQVGRMAVVDDLIDKGVKGANVYALADFVMHGAPPPVELAAPILGEFKPVEGPAKEPIPAFPVELLANWEAVRQSDAASDTVLSIEPSVAFGDTVIKAGDRVKFRSKKIQGAPRFVKYSESIDWLEVKVNRLGELHAEGYLLNRVEILEHEPAPVEYEGSEEQAANGRIVLSPVGRTAILTGAGVDWVANDHLGVGETQHWVPLNLDPDDFKPQPDRPFKKGDRVILVNLDERDWLRANKLEFEGRSGTVVATDTGVKRFGKPVVEVLVDGREWSIYVPIVELHHLAPESKGYSPKEPTR